MRYVDEYRNGEHARRIAERIRATVTQPWTLMEICGGQTHTIVKYGIEELLPENITLIHGPGCPVCVTPLEQIDKAIAVASRPNVILTSFGDMLRVPGSSKDLLAVKTEGGSVRIIYSPLDAVTMAQHNPDKEVVFFAVGFETTAPTTALAVREAARLHLRNFTIICSHVLVPPAIRTLLSSPHCRIQGLLAAGHVCTVMGYEEYIPIAATYKIPIVVTGFEPVDILQGVCMAVSQLEKGRSDVENQYTRSVQRKGNVRAQQLMQSVFNVTDRKWRGIGMIPESGFTLKGEFAEFDAELRFETTRVSVEESPLCIAGQILQGMRKPPECLAFGSQCTPERPLGAPMVSSEGACAAYYRYGAVKLEKKESGVLQQGER